MYMSQDTTNKTDKLNFILQRVATAARDRLHQGSWCYTLYGYTYVPVYTYVRVTIFLWVSSRSAKLKNVDSRGAGERRCSNTTI